MDKWPTVHSDVKIPRDLTAKWPTVQSYGTIPCDHLYKQASDRIYWLETHFNIPQKIISSPSRIKKYYVDIKFSTCAHGTFLE